MGVLACASKCENLLNTVFESPAKKNNEKCTEKGMTVQAFPPCMTPTLSQDAQGSLKGKNTGKLFDCII